MMLESYSKKWSDLYSERIITPVAMLEEKQIQEEIQIIEQKERQFFFKKEKK
jgi:hypothetical protein